MSQRVKNLPGFSLAHLPLILFTIFFGYFFAFPIGKVIYLAFMSNENQFTLDNFTSAIKFPYSAGFLGSLRLGLISASLASLPGAFAAYIIDSRGSARVKNVIAAMNGVLANTGGIPLAFAFTAAIGINGYLTFLLKNIGIDIYAGKFALGTFTGIVIVYLYFQIPLMIIVFSPAISIIRKESREAAMSLGANSFQFWRFIGIPLLLPSFVASFLLLFANGFSAYATANALTVGNVPLTPLQIAGLLNGNVSANQVNLGKALAVLMIIISAAAIIPYLIIQRRVQRWR